MMDEGQERVQATYRDNYDRLVAIKGRTTRAICSGSIRTYGRKSEPYDYGGHAASVVDNGALASHLH